MATVTFVLGLCGSGKTRLADSLVESGQIDPDCRFEESFLKDRLQHERLIQALRADRDCAVVEIAYCLESARAQILEELRQVVPSFRERWIYFENDLEQANADCRDRPDKPHDPTGVRHMAINDFYSPAYTLPEGAMIFPVWRPESSNREDR